jgi:hypothetical protein
MSYARSLHFARELQRRANWKNKARIIFLNKSLCTIAEQRNHANVEDKMFGHVCRTAPSLLEREKEGEAG